ncbi:hypothetical protein ASPNIDRAFT_124569, partial [Aspergillus niger ATCC 1015]
VSITCYDDHFRKRQYNCKQHLSRNAPAILWFCRDLQYIQAKDIIKPAEDESIFREWDDSETAHLSPCVDDNEYTKGWSGFGMPLITDFGEARVGEMHEGLIQRDIHRAPEVILGIRWTELKIWDLFEDHHLFDGRGLDGGHSDAQLLTEMVVAMLGPLPMEFLRVSPRSLEYWDTSGRYGWTSSIRQSIIGQ